MGTYKIGGAPLAYCLRVLLWGEIPQNPKKPIKTDGRNHHTQDKREGQRKAKRRATR